jgi:hypothetical protein
LGLVGVHQDNLLLGHLSGDLGDSGTHLASTNDSDYPDVALQRRSDRKKKGQES